MRAGASGLSLVLIGKLKVCPLPTRSLRQVLTLTFSISCKPSGESMLCGHESGSRCADADSGCTEEFVQETDGVENAEYHHGVCGAKRITRACGDPARETASCTAFGLQKETISCIPQTRYESTKMILNPHDQYRRMLHSSSSRCSLKPPQGSSPDGGVDPA